MDQDSNLALPESAARAQEAFAAWVPSAKERNDMIEVAAYHIAQRGGFKMDPQECWSAGEAQVDLMLSLRENQLKLQTILENSLDAVVMIDTDSVVTGWNPQAARIFGWTQAEAFGQPLHNLIIPPDHRATHLQGLKRYLASGEGPLLKHLIEVRAMHRDGHEFPIELTITPVRSSGKLEFNAFIRDISERKRIERIQDARLRLMRFAANHTLKELLGATLDEAGALTDSPIGFYHFLEADQKTLSLQAWSTRTTREFCTAAGEGSHYNIDAAGVWVECVRQRQAVIHNDYATLPNKRGLPPGHAMVLREMVVPVFRKTMIVAILGVGNKAKPYDQADLEAVTKLADLAWDIAESKRAEDERMAQHDLLERQVLERTAQLRTMAIELTMAEERERHLVAQDLHDSLGQTLAAAKLKLSALDLPPQDNPSGIQLQREVREIEALLDEANHAMRSLSLQLSPPALQELGLAPALEWLADEMLRSFRLNVRVSDDGLPKPLAEHDLKTIFRATRELLINVAKHAQVGSAEIEARREEDRLVLSVADAGIGFAVSKDSQPSAKVGYGLFSVRERIDFIGGKVQIDSSPGNGTVIVITAPLIVARE
ncbi:MAG: PAS domain S-box protein [Sterolibacterium sp.]